MNKLRRNVRRITTTIAIAAAAFPSLLLVLAVPAAEANTTRTGSCRPSDRSYTRSLRARGVSCRQARGIERYRANHDWKRTFRLYGRTWHATAHSRDGSTYYRFQSGRRIVWLVPTGSGLPLGGGINHNCNVMILGGESYGDAAPPLARTGYNKASNDAWGLSVWNDVMNWVPGPPPATLSGSDYVWWGTESGLFRGCWNNASYADQYGSVAISVSDPYSSGNKWSCTTTGQYVCTGPWNLTKWEYSVPPKSWLRGNELDVIFMVCPTNDPGCFRPGYDPGLQLHG